MRIYQNTKFLETSRGFRCYIKDSRGTRTCKILYEFRYEDHSNLHLRHFKRTPVPHESKFQHRWLPKVKSSALKAQRRVCEISTERKPAHINFQRLISQLARNTRGIFQQALCVKNNTARCRLKSSSSGIFLLISCCMQIWYLRIHLVSLVGYGAD